MGIKKLVTITVEAQIEIELADWAANPTAEDIESVNYCGFDVKNSDDIYATAGRLILNGYANLITMFLVLFIIHGAKTQYQMLKMNPFHKINYIYVEHVDIQEMGQEQPK
jgi:hypothetical protein